MNTNNDIGFGLGKSYATVEEAVADNAKQEELVEWLRTLSWQERAEWFALNGDENGSVNIEELE